MAAKSEKRYQSVSHDFKIAVVILLLAFTGIRLLLLQYFPSNEIIPDRFFLSVILSILFYLWVQEVVDFHRLSRLNYDLTHTHEQLKASEVDIIGALVKTEEAKDLYTKGHSERVTRIAVDIAEEIGLSDSKKNVISRAGILHDIGKIGLSDSILNKIDRLTDEEISIIRKHPEDGASIIEPLKFLSSEKDVIMQHHERYDGTGYPRGLKGEEINFEAMIIAVADAFDAMNSRRAYRKALERDAIIAELKKSRGTQHSPGIIDTFLKMLEKYPQLWEK